MTKRNTTKAVSPPGGIKSAVLTDEERQIVEQFNEMTKQSVEFKDGLPVMTEGKTKLLSVFPIMKACKSTGATTALEHVRNAATVRPWDNIDTCLSVAFSQIKELAPQSPLEAMLISQMVAVNTAIGKLMECGLLSDQTFAGKQLNMNLAIKLQRTFVQQVETLEKLRGNRQQTVRVEHVTVNAGGQAIVGHVEHKQGGRGKDEE